MPLDISQVTLSVIIGTLAAIVYSLRILVLMERRVARVEMHLEAIATKLLKEELKIEKRLNMRPSKKRKKR
jgi:hypothetical protein